MSSIPNRGFSKLHRNTESARWLGVCAGVADWLEIPAAVVRIVFVVSVLAWPTLAIGYFILYFCLSDEKDGESIKDYLKNNRTTAHFKKVNYRKPIYRNMAKKRISGVCAGFADYLEVSPFTVRLVTLGSLFIFGPFTFWAYVICIFVLDPDPATVSSDYFENSRRGKRQKRKAKKREREETRAGKSYVNEEASADMANEMYAASKSDQAENTSVDDCSEVYKKLERRLRSIEAYMTSKQFRLHCEINRI